MAHVTKNYNTDGGDTTVIGGKLVIEEAAVVEGLPQGAAVANSAAVDVAGVNVTVNALLASLRAAGIIATV